MAQSPSPAVLAAITACVVAAGAGAGLIFQPTKDPTVGARKGAGDDIAVVAPREPVPVPGGVTDVGDLADGRGQAPISTGSRLAYGGAPDEPPASFELRRVTRAPVVTSEPAPPPPDIHRRERPMPRPIAFDPPRPDYAAERRERMARLVEQRRLEDERAQERMDDHPDSTEPDYDRGREVWPDRDRRGRERQWYGSDGRPVRGPDFRD